jgi:hypothetical protein
MRLPASSFVSVALFLSFRSASSDSADEKDSLACTIEERI